MSRDKKEDQKPDDWWPVLSFVLLVFGVVAVVIDARGEVFLAPINRFVADTMGKDAPFLKQLIGTVVIGLTISGGGTLILLLFFEQGRAILNIGCLGCIGCLVLVVLVLAVLSCFKYLLTYLLSP